MTLAVSIVWGLTLIILASLGLTWSITRRVLGTAPKTPLLPKTTDTSAAVEKAFREGRVCMVCGLAVYHGHPGTTSYDPNGNVNLCVHPRCYKQYPEKLRAALGVAPLS